MEKKLETAINQDVDNENLNLGEIVEINKSINFYSLADLPLQTISYLKVSSISIFRDDVWDWRKEGIEIYKDSCFFSWNRYVSKDVSLLSIENRSLYTLLKMIAFYNLPQNACLINVKSYNSTRANLHQLMHLGKFLYKNKIFVDIQGNGSYVDTMFLRKEHFLDFIENDLLNDVSKIYRFTKQVKHWVGLSKSKLIPIEYRLNFDPFTEDEYRSFSKNAEDDKGVFLPISTDTLSELIPYCIDYIEKKSKEILSIYKILWPILAGQRNVKEQSFNWGDSIQELLKLDLNVLDLNQYKFKDYSEVTLSKELDKKLRNKIKNHPAWNINNPLYTSHIWLLKRPEIMEVAQSLKLNLEEIDTAIVYDLSKIKIKTMDLVNELRNSCVVVLFLVTGMRSSEMYLLEANNSWQVDNHNYRIKLKVSKTSEASTGDIVTLPIPEIAYKAFKCLEELTSEARKSGKTNKLMVSMYSNFGKEIVERSINQFIGRWCKELGIEHIHPHQFRKTIAMFAIYQDPNNISVIKRLFSHKSLAMTLSYVVKMPGMDEEIKKVVVEKNKELLKEILNAIENKCIGGVAGAKMKNLISEHTAYKARLNDNGWENLEQYIQILVEEGLTVLHRTSFGAICTNNHSGFSHLSNEQCNCNVTDCNWSIFTSNSVEDLIDTIEFHTKFLEINQCSESQKKFSNKTIRSCIDRLIELKGSEYVNENILALNIDNLDIGDMEEA